MTIQLDRPVPQTPSSRSWVAVVDVAGRFLLLAVIGLCLLSALPAQLAASRPAAQFSDDLRAGKVTSIQYVLASRTLRWSEGRLHWYATDLRQDRPAPGPSPDGMGTVTEQVEGNDPANNADAAWLTTVIDAAGRHQRFDIIDSHRSWMSYVTWPGLSTAAAVTGILTFFLMLGREHRRFGNRWAWFWVFTLGGVAGAVLFLVMEPSPIWRGTADSRPYPDRPAFLGGAGLLIGLLLKAAVGTAAGLVLLT